MMPFTDEDIYHAVLHNLPKTTEYVKSHGGGIELVCVKDGKVYIKLTGTCHGCSMSLMTTKMVVQKELRALIHPELEVVNVDGTPENEPPQDCYRPEEEATEEAEKETKEGMLSKVKKALSL